MPASVVCSGDPAGRPHFTSSTASRRGELHRHGRVQAVAVASAAVVWGGVLELRAAFVFGTHREDRGQGLIDLSVVDSTVVLGGLLGAIIWDLVTWWLGLPTSSSHALIGGYAGGCGRQSGFARSSRALDKTLIFIVRRAVMGFMLALLLTVALSWALRRSLPRRVDKTFRVLQCVGGGLLLGHARTTRRRRWASSSRYW